MCGSDLTPDCDPYCCRCATGAIQLRHQSPDIQKLVRRIKIFSASHVRLICSLSRLLLSKILPVNHQSLNPLRCAASHEVVWAVTGLG